MVFGVLPFWMESIWSVLASLFVVGAAEAFIMTCGNALLGDYFPPEPRKRWLGVQGVLGSILATLIMLAGGALGNIDWHYPFLVNLLGGVVFVWLLLYTWEPEKPAAVAQDARAPARAGFSWPLMLPVYALSMFTGIFYFFQIQMGHFFSKLGVQTPFEVSLITTIASIGVICGGWYFRQQRGRSVAFNVMLIFTAYGIGFIGIGLAPDYKVALPFAIVAQFGNGLFVPTFVGWALGKLEPQHRGFGMGIWTSSFFSAQFLSPPILALVAGMRGDDVLAAVLVVGVAGHVPAAFSALRARTAPPAGAGAH